MDNKLDMAQLMNMLSKMDKKELESNLSKVSKMLNSKDADNIINQIKNAADLGEKEITLYVPDYKTYDNFPLANYGGNRFSSALYRHKITPYMVSVTEVVPIDDFYERFGVYDTM